MEWRDAAIIIGLRRHGESSVIAELMTREHGRHLGLVRGGRSRRMQPILQPGNQVDAVWRARLEEQLGFYAIESVKPHASSALVDADALSLQGINLICALLRLFAERDPHPNLFDASLLVLHHVADREIGPPLMARLELAVLGELGFGLDLARCAATGGETDLAYVSPKSGRAVSRTAGEPWKDKLFVIPAFLQPGGRDCQPRAAEVCAAFRMTGHFLIRDVLSPRGIGSIEARRAYVSLLEADEPPEGRI
jgi:DNA repair protein RecO (recombination protein O)